MFFYTYNWYLAIIFEIFIKKKYCYYYIKFLWYIITDDKYIIRESVKSSITIALRIFKEYYSISTDQQFTAEQFKLILTIYIYTKIHYNKKNSKKLRKN